MQKRTFILTILAAGITQQTTAMELVPFGYPVGAPFTSGGTAIINPIAIKDNIATVPHCPSPYQKICKGPLAGIAIHLRADLNERTKDRLYKFLSEPRFCQKAPYYAIIDNDLEQYKATMNRCKTWFAVHEYGRPDYDDEIYNDMLSHLAFAFGTDDAIALHIVHQLEPIATARAKEGWIHDQQAAIRLIILALNHHNEFSLQGPSKHLSHWHHLEGSILNLAKIIYPNIIDLFDSVFRPEEKELFKKLVIQYQEQEKNRAERLERYKYYYDLLSKGVIYGGGSFLALALTVGAALPFLPY